MLDVVVLFASGCVVLAFALYTIGGRVWSLTYFLAAVAVVVFGSLVFRFAPEELGVGRVSSKTEDLARRLDAGVIYQIIASSEVDNGNLGYVIVVKKAIGEPDIRALHVEKMPPGIFILMNDNTVPVSYKALLPK